MAVSADTLKARIAQARGAGAADLVIKDGRLFDLVTGAVTQTDIAIVRRHHRRHLWPPIAAPARSTGGGASCVPGFIDTHLHVESSLVTPLEFDRCVLPHGVTTAICDPHEIANVLGTAAFDWFLASAERTVMDLRVQLSSCVPATGSGDIRCADRAPRNCAAIAAIRKVIGLAEFMNYPGVLGADPACLAKLAAFSGRPYRRPRAARQRTRAQRLSRRRHPHRPRGDERRGGAREDPQGHDRPDPRGLGVEGPARAAAAP